MHVGQQLSLTATALLFATSSFAQQPDAVPITIKELDVQGAIREFQTFQKKLGEYRSEIGEGRAIAKETSQILAELQATATPENNFNEGPILESVTSYVDGMLGKQVELVDFLESQRYRISYYANKMASSVRPEDLAVLFGTVEQNDQAIAGHVAAQANAQARIADFIDDLPKDWFDPKTFRPTRAMPRDQRGQLDNLLYQYQQEKAGLDFAKKRLQLVRVALRNVEPDDAGPEIDADLLVGQMFGALDRIRLQMSMDLLFLENLLGGYARSSRTQEILQAFQDLVELQGDMEGPSPELSSVLDWLQDSSTRRISLGARGVTAAGLNIPRYSDILREAYQGARGPE